MKFAPGTFNVEYVCVFVVRKGGLEIGGFCYSYYLQISLYFFVRAHGLKFLTKFCFRKNFGKINDATWPFLTANKIPNFNKQF